MSQRPLFDASRGPSPSGAQGPDAAPGAVLSVRQVTALVRQALERHLPPTLSVLGELGDLSRPGSGHLYFTLKDASSELRCVMWRSAASKLRFAPEPGMELIATGSIEVYEPRGTYQLIVRRLEPRGVGALELAFRQLKEKLEREGLFDPARKRRLPAVPFRIALVTSPDGAAIRDILRTLERRFPVLDILVFPVRVQGDGAAQEIADAIRLMNRLDAELGGIDAAIVGRGGGSAEDLWAFNEEVLARAVAGSAIPIISAVGHETDVSICDLAADVRAATPTAAAELVAPPLADLVRSLDAYAARAARIAAHRWSLATARLERATASGWLSRPLLRLRERAQRMDELEQRLRHALADRLRHLREHLARREVDVLRLGSAERFAGIERRLDAAVHRAQWAIVEAARRGERRLAALLECTAQRGPQSRLARLDERLAQAVARLAAALRASLARRRERLRSRVRAARACDPRRVLRRGFSITRESRTGRLLRSVQEVRGGMYVVTQLADGSFRSVASDPRQPGLFDGD